MKFSCYCFLLLWIFFYQGNLWGAPLSLELEAEAAILMNGKSGKILFEKNSRIKHYPASITKIATGLFALLVGEDKLNNEVVIDQECVARVSTQEKIRSAFKTASYLLEPDAIIVSLKSGEILTLQQLLYGMMLTSGGDASNAIAKYLGGTIPRFMDYLNLYLKKIGCMDTYFTNPHGLFHPEHVTTAYDMALLTKEALKQPAFRQIVKTVNYTCPATNLQKRRKWTQTNRLLRPGKLHYSQAIGVKTGYLQAAQNTLVAAAENEGRLLIAVLLKCKERSTMFKEARKLFEAAFSEKLENRVLLKKGTQPFKYQLSNAIQPIETALEEDLIVQYYPSEEPKLTMKLTWDKVVFPVRSGQRVGKISVVSDDGVHNRVIELKAQNDVQEKTWHRFFSAFKEWSSLRITAAILLIIFIVLGLVFRSFK